MTVLRQRFVMHARMQNGSMFIHDIIDEAGAVVGQKTTTTDRKKRTESTTYVLGDVPYSTAVEFKRAYEARERSK